MDIAESYRNLKRLFRKQEENDKAIEYGLKALEVKKTIFGKTHAEISYEYNSLAHFYFDLADDNNAVECLSRAIRIKEAVYRKQDKKLAQAYLKLALELENLGAYRRGMVYAQKAIQVLKFINCQGHDSVHSSFEMEMSAANRCLESCQIELECMKIEI